MNKFSPYKNHIALELNNMVLENDEIVENMKLEKKWNTQIQKFENVLPKNKNSIPAKVNPARKKRRVIKN